MLKNKYAELLPPLSSEEFDALSASIKNDGIREAIIIDEDENILDGVHRYKICPSAPTRTITGLTEAEKQAFVLQVNFTRRNLSPSQKVEVRKSMQKIAKELRNEDPKKNTQARIAAMLGVGLETVSRWLRKGTNSHMGNASVPDARVSGEVS